MFLNLKLPLMENIEFANQITLYSQLLELEGEAFFKLQAYNNAVESILALKTNIMEMADAEIRKIPAVGEAIFKKIIDAKQNGMFHQLTNKLQNIPIGVVGILKVPGLGVKKVRLLWQEHNITDTKMLLEACENDEIAQIKGFGKKTQESIKQYLLYQEGNSGKIYYAHAKPFANKIFQYIQLQTKDVGADDVYPAGETKRHSQIVETIEFVCNIRCKENLMEALDKCNFLEKNIQKSGVFLWAGHFKSNLLKMECRFVSTELMTSTRFLRDSSEEHLFYAITKEKNANLKENQNNLWNIVYEKPFSSEEEIYKTINMPNIPAYLRENMGEFDLTEIPEALRWKTLKGILHNHSTYSDGKNTLQEMAEATKNLGFSYFGISDHSKTAVYANGLNENRVLHQFEAIQQLNQAYISDNFKVFAGIESDILGNGDLDYKEEILKKFDFIVASIHSGFKMTQEQATKRMIKAIENPYTTILGHPTGRILLKREGYSLDMHQIIDACIANQVAIELNASPYRLDLDWKWIKIAVDKGAWISINPDAHDTAGLEDMQYGVLVANKGYLPISQTLNGLDIEQVQRFFRKEKI
jgi:DNA polymerase (family X)